MKVKQFNIGINSYANIEYDNEGNILGIEIHDYDGRISIDINELSMLNTYIDEIKTHRDIPIGKLILDTNLKLF